VKPAIPRHPWARAVAVLVPLLLAGLLVWERGPSWGDIGDAFEAVEWEWIVAALGLNLASILARSIAWTAVINQAMPPPHPRFRSILSAFSIGLLGNAVLPGRIGELARVAVLTRNSPRRRGTWARLVGTVFAHRVFDLVPLALLAAFVLRTAELPAWAISTVIGLIVLAAALLAFSIASARRYEVQRLPLEALGAVRRLVTMARQGLGVMHAPLPAAFAVILQCVGWGLQLFAVYAVMEAFQVEEGLAVAALVLVLMNVVTIFPLWPGNVGLLQAAIALPLVPYGVAYAHGIAFGIGLQAVEAGVGVVLGLICLGREGLTFATLREMPEASEAELPRPAEHSVDDAPARAPG
jgi:glycosyltransferase 2 family protein